MQDNRFAELREGVWLRPDNLADGLPAQADGRVRVLRSRDDQPADLAARLWDLPGWAQTARQLLHEMDSATDIPGRFAVAAAMVRHLLADPVLPAELLPGDWPADRMRAAYADFAALLVARRDTQLVEV
jgi:phenylacetic acid degradation operon negative regulatory protein